LKFYTHVHKAFDKIYVRGYEDGRRFKDQVEYRPHIFISSSVLQNPEYTTLDGKPVAKIHPGTMRDTVKYIEEYKGVAGHEVYGYGQESFHYQYINEEFPGEVNYDPSLISVVTLDIETDSEGGFPNIKTADKALTLHCLW